MCGYESSNRYFCHWVAHRKKALFVREDNIEVFSLQMAPRLVNLQKSSMQHISDWFDECFQWFDFCPKTSTSPFNLEGAELVKHTLAFNLFVDDIGVRNTNCSVSLL